VASVLIQHERNLIHESHAGLFLATSNALPYVNLVRMELDAKLKTRIKWLPLWYCILVELNGLN